MAFDLLGSGKSKEGSSYDYKEQLEALHNSILKLKVKTPLVLVGHSMGSLIVAKYADIYKKSVKKLILASPPVYRPEDLESPAFLAGFKLFEEAISVKDRKVAESAAFLNSMKKIVMNKKNYAMFQSLKTPAVLIYGEADRMIAPFNITRVAKENPKYLSVVRTVGRHGMSRDKYSKMVGMREEVLNA